MRERHKLFVGVDVAHAAQHALIEQQRFDAARANARARANSFSVISRESEAERGSTRFAAAAPAETRPHSAESADVGVAQLAAVVEREKNVRVRRHRRFRHA